MILTPRLKAIFDCVPSGAVVLDMGTDHGYLPVALIKSGRVERAVASDISAPSLKKAEKEIICEGLSDKIETRLGNGLSVVQPGECNVIVMAGMGGHLISAMILEYPEIVKNTDCLVLQPMTNVDMVRRILESQGFCITAEVLALEESRIYQIISASCGKMKIKHPIEYRIGYEPCRKNTPLFRRFVEREIETERKILRHVTAVNTPNARLQAEKSADTIQIMKEVLNHGSDV